MAWLNFSSVPVRGAVQYPGSRWVPHSSSTPESWCDAETGHGQTVKVLPLAVLPGDCGSPCRAGSGDLLAHRRAEHEALGRRLHQADSHDDRTADLLYRDRGNRQHRRHEETGTGGHQGAALLRSGDYAGARHRPAGGDDCAARARNEREPCDARRYRHPRLRQPGPATARRGLPAQHHPRHTGRRFCQRRDPPGAVAGHFIWMGAGLLAARRTHRRGLRQDRPRAVPRDRQHHAGRTGGRVRRDRLYHRQVRHRDPKAACQGPVVRLLHLGGLYFCRPGADLRTSTG